MRALTVLPGTVNSLQLDDIPDPHPRDGRVLVRALALGICGTDREIVSGKYGSAPPGQKRLVLGHESLGRVENAPPNSGLTEGDLVVGIVRQPDPVPCVNCAAGEWDMCRNGRYTEHGIKERNGFGAERWQIDPAFAVKVDPALGDLGVLVEPDVVLECTGAPQVVIEVMGRNAPNGIVCLAGVSAAGTQTLVDAGALNRTIVLQNDVVFGSVNANRRHYEAGVAALLRADQAWLRRLVTRRVPLSRWREALEPQPGDVKTVLDFTAAA